MSVGAPFLVSLNPKPLNPSVYLGCVVEGQAKTGLTSMYPQTVLELTIPKAPSIIMVYTYRVFWGSKYIP